MPLGDGARTSAIRLGRLYGPQGGGSRAVLTLTDYRAPWFASTQIASDWFFGTPAGAETGGARSDLAAGGAATTTHNATGGGRSAMGGGGSVSVAWAQTGGGYSEGRASGRGYGGPKGIPAYVIDQGIASSAAAGTTLDIAQAVDVMPGDWLVMTGCSASGTANVTGIAIVNGVDPGDLSWTIHDVAGNATGAFIAYTQCPTGLSGVTFRISWSGVAFGTRRAGLAEFARIRTSSPPEVAHAELAAAGSSNHPTVSIVVGEANTMVIASIGFQAATTMTPDLGWQEFHDDSGGSRTSSAIYAQQTASGTFDPGSTAGSSNRWAIAAIDLAGDGAIQPQTGGAYSAMGAGGSATVSYADAGGAYSPLAGGGDADVSQAETGGARSALGAGGAVTVAYAASGGGSSSLTGGGALTVAWTASGGAYAPLRGGEAPVTPPGPTGGVGGAGPPILDRRVRGHQDPAVPQPPAVPPRLPTFTRVGGGAVSSARGGGSAVTTTRPRTEDDVDALVLLGYL